MEKRKKFSFVKMGFRQNFSFFGKRLNIVEKVLLDKIFNFSIRNRIWNTARWDSWKGKNACGKMRNLNEEKCGIASQ